MNLSPFGYKVICIKSIPHPKVSYTKGELYQCSEQNGIYTLLSDGKYIRTFNEKSFNIYFSKIDKLRDKLNKLGINNV